MDVYKDSGISLDSLKTKTVAIIGYGNQGRPQALNLRDSGIDVVVGIRQTSGKQGQIESDSLRALPIPQAVAKSDVIMMMLPDETMGQTYAECVEPNLRPGRYLGFSHGMAITAGWVKPDPSVNVFLLAPKAQGRGVRNRYVEGSGVPGLVAIHQDSSGDTLDVALAYGKAIGCGRTGILKTTFQQETYSDLFSEQAVLCGGLTQMIRTAFEVLVEAGFAPEVAYFECLYEVKLIADLLQEGGINFMRSKISSTALYGDLVSGEKVIDSHVKESMRQVLANIQSGQFADAFMAEVQSGRKLIHERILQDEHHLIEETGKQLRSEGIL